MPDAAPVVVLAHHVVEPRRAAALMARDIPHVPLVFTGVGSRGRTLRRSRAHRVPRVRRRTPPRRRPGLAARRRAAARPARAGGEPPRWRSRRRSSTARLISEAERRAARRRPLPDAARGFAAPVDRAPTGRTQSAGADLSQESRRLPVPRTSRPRQRQRSPGPRDADVGEAPLLVDLLERRRVADRQQPLRDARGGARGPTRGPSPRGGSRGSPCACAGSC